MSGLDRAAEGLRADWQRDLALVHRECGFKYVRFHGLLQDEMGVYSENAHGQPVYNFQYIDALYDAILNTGMKPFVELGFMPQALASGTKTIFWWKGNVTPPKDYDKWENLIRALVQHWTDRYGTQEVKQWYFEVWNEPNLDGFWSGTQADYFKLYSVTARAIKNVSPDYRVGGPATAGNAWVRETIEFASTNHVALDFITTHDYGVKGIGLDEGGQQQLQLMADPGAIINGVRNSRSQISKSPLPNLPLHYTEWSTSYSPRDPVHDSYISAAYILSKLKGTEGYADSMSYWTFTDIFEETGPVPSPFHGGFGLVNFQGLRKPSFYAYQFLNRLGDTELISSDADSWVCKSDRGRAGLVLELHVSEYDRKQSEVLQARCSVEGSGTIETRIDRTSAKAHISSAFTDWLSNQRRLRPVSADGFSGESFTIANKRAGRKSDGRPVFTNTIKIGGRTPFPYDVRMLQNDVFLITLERMR